MESRGWIGRGYSHGAQEFRSVLEGCFASLVRVHDPCHSQLVPAMLNPGICTHRIVSSAYTVGPNAYSMIIELCNACI